MNKVELLQKISALATECHALACDLDIGDDRIEAFEIYEVLRRIQRCGAAGEMLAATNPLLCPGIVDDTEWTDIDDEDDD
ncbi:MULTISPECIES: hypothetical protein [Klebsiella pneumoniae complex]|uniref:hypothetical protein n=1 Tax=Klebsiella pneumoniae complex TaxID=3390273 RepID=UPI000C7A41B3|nr:MULTISPECIES: hypothetical protein [Klebsiella]MBC4284412.1 hypothetical protein [Klebsiella pneumoniae]MDV0625644.1 hypothetical protein [Klebsiella variicola subsp. variicola]PLC80502.1 hypothetical protein B6I41_25205 [Klebsiella pneumoniae]HBW6841810.1 hypothetical protein [Klebsiella pneumoniae]HBW7282843.1 hypothetical protein [Klebsiella pneumoniae]